PQIGGRLLTRRALRTTFDWVYVRILQQLDALPEDELQRGMYYPDRWEPLFREYMTLEDIFRYPTLHFQSHRQHIAR
ncbi:MAG TPA: DinB family protein, partial [Gammaproteobacteria bacterium]|nr:DinB family protein [Gammaproteobacteria bacterium]